MLEKLTPEQEALIPIVRDEWINRLDACPEIDREKAEAGIKWLYSVSKLKEPKVIFVSSPLGAQYAANMIGQVDNRAVFQVRDQVWDQVGDQVRDQVGDQVRAQVRDQVRDQVWDQVWAQVRDQVWAQVWAQVRDQVGDQVRDQVRAQVWAQVWAQVRDQVWDQVWAQVGDQVRDQVRDQVWDQVGDQVRDQVRDQVWDQVWAQVRDQVWAQVGAQVRDQVGDQVRDQVRAQVWAQVWAQVGDQVRAKHLHFFEFARYGNVFDFGWGSFYEFFQRVGQSLGKAERQFDAFKNLITSGIYDMIQFDGLCIVCEMPRAIHRDGARRLHSTGGPSIIWADGFELYHLWGVAFPKELHEKITSRAISAKDVLKIENMEQRMAALKSLGAESVIEALDSKLVATSERGNALYAIKGIGRQKNYCLKYKCPSTNREYVSFVPPEVGRQGDPDECMAWKFSITKEQYQNMRFET